MFPIPVSVITGFLGAGKTSLLNRLLKDPALTEAQVRYVIAELGHYAALRDAPAGIEVSAVDGVWQSDTLVGERLRSRLREAVRVLEEVPEAERDWHPGSDGQVLDLVHPSLFCLVRDVSGGPERAWHNPANPYAFDMVRNETVRCDAAANPA